MIVLVLLGGGAAVVSNIVNPSENFIIVKVRVPELSALAKRGKISFDKNCAQCHGANGSGTDKGPPFVHTTYNPGHHGDDAFYRAAKKGVQSHHWPFGNMPAQPQVSDRQLAGVIKYVRELQQANGIYYKAHRM